MALDGGSLGDEVLAVVTHVHQAHVAYGQALNGLLGRKAPGEILDLARRLVRPKASAATRQRSSPRPTSSKTRQSPRTPSLIGQIAGTDGAGLLASILIAEARHATVFADLAGETDLDALLSPTPNRSKQGKGEPRAAAASNSTTSVLAGASASRRSCAAAAAGCSRSAAARSARPPCWPPAGQPDGAGLARVGNAPTTTALPEPVINDAVLLRTASSLEQSIVSVYDMVIDNAELLDPSHNDLAKRFRDDHLADAAVFEQLTTDIGGRAVDVQQPAHRRLRHRSGLRRDQRRAGNRGHRRDPSRPTTPSATC